jgi:hypothetical protein
LHVVEAKNATQRTVDQTGCYADAISFGRLLSNCVSPESGPRVLNLATGATYAPPPGQPPYIAALTPPAAASAISAATGSSASRELRPTCAGSHHLSEPPRRAHQPSGRTTRPRLSGPGPPPRRALPSAKRSKATLSPRVRRPRPTPRAQRHVLRHGKVERHEQMRPRVLPAGRKSQLRRACLARGPHRDPHDTTRDRQPARLAAPLPRPPEPPYLQAALAANPLSANVT